MTLKKLQILLSCVFLALMPGAARAQAYGPINQADPVPADRVYEEGELSVADMLRLLTPDPQEDIRQRLLEPLGRSKGYRPNGRWVNIAQDNLDNCFSRTSGLPTMHRSKGAAGQPFVGTDKVVPINFRYGNNQHTLSNKGLDDVAKLAQVMNSPKYLGRHFVIEGHANQNPTDTDAVNLDVTCRRAAYIREQLRARHGVDADSIHAIGYAARQPLPDRPVSDPSNRRVVVRLLAQ